MKNILLIICDQLSATALKAYGNNYVNAPNINSLAENGVVFDNAYTTCPLCQPARASFWSSKYPHQTKVLSNLPNQGFPTIAEDIITLGDMFSQKGYDCVHFGKRHDYGALRGFRVVDSTQIPCERDNPAINVDYETFLDEDTTQKIVGYFNNDLSDSPFLAVADLQNPHNICSYIGENEHGHKNFNIGEELPKLPDNYNFEDAINRPEFIQYLCCAHRRQSQTINWEEEDFKHYLYAYYYYIGLVDKQIGKILDALKETGKAEDTLIAFFADHGEGMASHRLVTKYGAFYEETNRVPLIFTGNTVAGNRHVDGLTSLLDVVPTLVDYAGMDVPDSMEGRSQYPQVHGESDTASNDYVVAEWYDEYSGYIVPGRMYLDGQYKYTVYLEEDSEELFNMLDDRGEKVNLAALPEYQEILHKYRLKLKEHLEKTKDDFFSLKSHYGNQYRKHKRGMHNHNGPNAVLDYSKSISKA